MQTICVFWGVVGAGVGVRVSLSPAPPSKGSTKSLLIEWVTMSGQTRRQMLACLYNQTTSSSGGGERASPRAHARTHALTRAHSSPLRSEPRWLFCCTCCAYSPPPLQCPPLCLCVPSANFAVKVSDRRQIYTYHFMAATNAPPDSLLSIHAASLRCAPGFRSCRWVRVCARPSDVRLKAQQTRHDQMISLTEIILQSLEKKKKKKSRSETKTH